MEAITFTLPAIPAAVIADVEATEQLVADNELAFIAELRARYGALAKHAGFIKISQYKIGNQNWEQEYFPRQFHGLVT